MFVRILCDLTKILLPFVKTNAIKADAFFVGRFLTAKWRNDISGFMYFGIFFATISASYSDNQVEL